MLIMESEIVKAFEDIDIHRLEYCCLCLRTELERRIVSSCDALDELMEALNATDHIIPKSVCFICEPRINAALQLFKELKCASATHQLWSSVQKNHIKKSLLHQFLNNKLKGNWPKYEAAARLERQFNIYRNKINLVHTEVLLVDNSTEYEKLNEQLTLQQRPDNNADETPTLPRLEPRPKSKDPDVVVVLDDEEELQSIPKQHTYKQIVQPMQTESIIPNLQPVILQSQNAILHPVVCNTSGALIVPTLSCEIIDGQLKVLNSLPQIPNTSGIEKSVLNLKALNASNGNDNLVDNLKGPKKRSLSAAESAKKIKGRQQLEVVNITSEISDHEAPAKHPVTDSRRIDWEDKIPMDVISFMDATDPNIGSIFKQTTELGVISDVRTVVEPELIPVQDSNKSTQTNFIDLS